MNRTIRSLSETEIDVVAGGRQNHGDLKSLVVMPDPGFVIDTTTPRLGPSSFSWSMNQEGTFS
jgi:hypothetical protein